MIGYLCKICKEVILHSLHTSASSSDGPDGWDGKISPLYCQNPNSRRHPLCIHACISLYTHALVILSCYHTFSSFAPVCVDVLYIYIFHMLYTHIYLYFSIYSLTFYMTVAITMSTVVYITSFCIVLYDSYLA